MTRIALILGGSGRMGRHAAQAFAAAGWQVRRFDRATGDLAAAARGARIIVNAWNPPYPDWQAQVPALHDAVQQAALAAGATVIVPGNVYVFGPSSPAPWSAASPHRATNPLGRIRIAMEDSYRRSGTRTILLRAGDFLDTEASGNWFDRMLAPGIARGRFTWPGDPDAAHAWAFLPDLARAMVALADRADDLPAFADIPFPGYTLSGRQMADHLAGLVGHPLRIHRFPWWQLRLARPFWPLARHLLEMRYLWSLPHSLDGTRFRALCPDCPDTPVDEALARAIRPL
ncbi:epimerase [Marinibacterium sp. SX1]|uniref:epimerase n=1 Tax=Marinibacterium sp. SX1 TaxID=3388424 RepID=UPI003D17649B